MEGITRNPSILFPGLLVMSILGEGVSLGAFTDCVGMKLVTDQTVWRISEK